MKIYFIYNKTKDCLMNIGTKKFSGYKTRKTAQSYLDEWKKRYLHLPYYSDLNEYEVVEIELK